MKSYKEKLEDIEGYHGWTKGNIRFLFPDQSFAENYFSFESLKLLYQLRHDLEILTNQGQESLRKNEKVRVETARVAKEKMIQSLISLLNFLEYDDIQAEELQSYLSQSPEPSALTPNLDNAFRDWAWGDEEVTQFHKLVEESLSAAIDFSDILCLGVGSGRLCYEVVKSKSFNLCVFNDFNPLLLKIAERVISGNKLKLYEKPVLPQKSEDIYLQRTLSCEKVLKNINYVVADARTRFLKGKKISFMLTPWLIDTVDWPLELFFQHLNWFLKIEGTWVNVGPLHFQNRGLAKQATAEDIKEFAEKAGFECQVENSVEAPYMKCQESGSYRMERIHCFTFKKIKEVEAEEFTPMSLEPKWIQAPDKKINLPVDQKRLISGHEMNAKILKLVDGTKSLNEISEKIAKEFKTTPDKVIFHVSQIIKNSVLRVE